MLLLLDTVGGSITYVFETCFQVEVKCHWEFQLNKFNSLTQNHMFLLTLLHFTVGRFVNKKTHVHVIHTSFFFPSCSKWQREGGNYHKQNVFADFRARDQADQSVWPGHHPHPQALPHRQPQYPGPVAPIHQPAPVYWPHQTTETRC